MLFNQALEIPNNLKSNGLEITLMSEHLRYSLRLKKTDLVEIKKLTGYQFPTQIGKADISSAREILCLGPDEWLLIANVKEKAKLAKAFVEIEKVYVVSITDISHRNVGFILSGNDAVKMINVGCPLDLSLDAFPIGKTTRTVFESASIILTRKTETEFNIECWRSFAPYLRDFFARIVNTHG